MTRKDIAMLVTALNDAKPCNLRSSKVQAADYLQAYCAWENTVRKTMEYIKAEQPRMFRENDFLQRCGVAS